MSGAASTGSDAGTITMYADQQAIFTEEYTVPTGATLIPGTETIDDPTLVSVTAGTIGAASGSFSPFAGAQAITIQGLGKVGTTVVHFNADGVDNADLTVELIARPDEQVTINTTGVTIQDTPPATPPAS
jgi:hypothetical protein